MNDVKAAFADYYKAERNRCEACLADIIKILETEKDENIDTTGLIIDRLLNHYRRDDT